MTTPEQAVLNAMLVCLGAALMTLLLARRKTLAGWVAFVAVLASSLLVFAGCARVLSHGAGEGLTVLAIRPLGFALRLSVDGLSAVFLALIGSIAVPAAFYSIEYMRHHREHGVGRYYPNFLLFLAAMYGLVSTTDMMWFFFIFWQMMTWAGWALIRYERRKPENAWAATKYLWMMQIACAATMAGAALLTRPGLAGADPQTLLRYDFDTVCQQMPGLLRSHPGDVALAFGLFLVGFGIKAGMWPFGQVWLPDAHPAAPSPVSAMLSGVMIKTGVYGLMRYFLWLLPVEARTEYPLGNWGFVLAALGTVTLFTGTAQALKQDQLKRLLAFSSIGQVGYILLGLGATLTLLASAEPGAATLAAAGFSGTLFHTLNHGTFKSLLFLNAGAVLHATGTQDLNKLGGLMRWMPVTAGTAMVAAFSIAGVPLSSGFASKWSLLVAAIQGSPAGRWLPLCALIAIFTSALTLALFIKFFGATFLARTSRLVSEHAAGRPTLEVGWQMRLPQLWLAGVCLGLGLVPMLALSFIRHALNVSRQGWGTVLADALPASGGWSGLGAASLPASYVPVVVAGVLLLLFALVVWGARSGGASRRTALPWLCGYAREAEANRYRAGALFGEARRYFGWVGGAPRPESEPSPAPNRPQRKEGLAWSLEKD